MNTNDDAHAHGRDYGKQMRKDAGHFDNELLILLGAAENRQQPPDSNPFPCGILVWWMMVTDDGFAAGGLFVPG